MVSVPGRAQAPPHQHAQGLTYLEWNNRLAAHFFNRDMAGRRVYLYTTEDLIEDIGGPDAGLDDFIAKVKVGPPWGGGRGLFQHALDISGHWRWRSNLSMPPYIGYLALFALAAGRSGDFTPHSYYPRLRDVLALPGKGAPPCFDRMWTLWQDLEQWSNEDKGGELGVFTATATGSWRHVGLPISQMLLDEDERRALPDIFARSGFDHISPPSDQALATALRARGSSTLRSRTLSLLASADATPARSALLTIVLEELDDWDGTVTALSPSAPTSGRVFAALRLCCAYDPVAQHARVTLRCSTAHDLPEGGLSLTRDGQNGHLTCEEFGTGWTEPITRGDGSALDAATLDWRCDATMRDVGRAWSLVLPGAPVRVLVAGSTFGLPNLVEVQQLPAGTPFYLLVGVECWEEIEEWGEVACEGFRAIPVASGLPTLWRLYAVERALGDAMVRHLAPALAFPATFRLDLAGGVRVERGSKYFRFAPPRVVVRGPLDGVDVSCNDVPLVDGGDGTFVLPAAVLADSQLSVVARRGDEEVGRTLYLLDSFPWQDLTPARVFDSFGRPLPLETSEDWAAGARVTGGVAPPAVFGVLDGLRDERVVILIGRQPGQIARWPEEPPPADWTPVWAITGKKRLRAVFREMDADTAGPEAAPRPAASRKKQKEWKDVLWHGRKRIEGPRAPKLQRLWDRYREEARHVHA